MIEKCDAIAFAHESSPRDIWLHSNPKYHHNHDGDRLAQDDADFMCEFREQAKLGTSTCSVIWSGLAK